MSTTSILILMTGGSVVLMAGCSATGGISPGSDAWASPLGRGPVSSVHASDAAKAARDLTVAQRMVRAGEYSLAIPRLQQLVSNYPGEPTAVDARYYLGRAYYAVGAYNDALRYFNEYAELAPDGAFAEESREHVARLTQGPTPPHPTELEQKALALQAAIDAAPEEMAPRLELADLYWGAGEYETAGGVYRELLRRWPNLAQDMAVRRRVETDDRGQVVVLTPDEVKRRYRESEPLLIYNVSSFRSGRFEGWQSVARERYYNVTGHAVNQSARAINDVRIAVTIYGFGHVVYDSRNVFLGTLRPGERRAFSVQFSAFDDIHNIVRHECVGSYTQ